MRKRPPPKEIRFTVTASTTDKTTGGSRYEIALDWAIHYANDPNCHAVEIYRSGKNFQSWRRNPKSGEWDFRGYLIGATK